MNPLALLLLAFSMSADAFAVAIGKGAGLKNPRFTEALKMGLIFGTIEAVTPLVGWLIGNVAALYVTAFGHWIAFAILLALGLHMLCDGLKPDTDETVNAAQRSLFRLALAAFGTSVDALAAGASLAFVEVNILLAAGLIGLATTSMVTAGVLLGQYVGALLGQRAEIAGGLVLITIGVWLLLGH